MKTPEIVVQCMKEIR